MCNTPRQDHPRRIQPTRLVWRLPGDEGRPELERHVADVYRVAYGASLRHFHRALMAVLDDAGELMGVIGATVAERGTRLFVEQYLDEPVERVVSRVAGDVCPRESVAEVGNLASGRPGTGIILISTMARALMALGCRHAVFAATSALRNRFERMGVTSFDAGPADGRRLGAALAEWGTYYETQPRVLVMDTESMVDASARDTQLAQRMSAVWRAASANPAVGRQGRLSA